MTNRTQYHKQHYLDNEPELKEFHCHHCGTSIWLAYGKAYSNYRRWCNSRCRARYNNLYLRMTQGMFNAIFTAAHGYVPPPSKTRSLLRRDFVLTSEHRLTRRGWELLEIGLDKFGIP